MEVIIVLKEAGTDIIVSPSLNNSSLVDIAPTILQLMGVPILSDIDGKSLTQLSRDMAGITIDPEREKDREFIKTEGLTKEAEEDIEKRLKSLAISETCLQHNFCILMLG